MRPAALGHVGAAAPALAAESRDRGFDQLDRADLSGKVVVFDSGAIDPDAAQLGVADVVALDLTLGQREQVGRSPGGWYGSPDRYFPISGTTVLIAAGAFGVT